MTAADDPRDGHNWRQVPDPTTLTTEQLRRELSGLREILTARLDGMDTATELLSATVNRTPTVIQTEISHVRELMTEKLGSLGGAADEKFHSIELQFAERDVRTTQAATASAVFEQAQAAAKAAEKTELAFSKQVDQIQLQIRTVSDGLGDKIDDLKGRIDRGEGSTAGAAGSRTEHRLDTGQMLLYMLVAVAILSLIVAYAVKK